MEEDEGTEEQERFSHRQRLKAAVHYTVGCLCEDVASDKEVQFSKQTIAAISELTFRQCEHFAKDLEMFASICRKEVIELKKSLMTFLAGWSQWIPPGRCSALLRRGSRGGTRVAAGPPTQRSLQEKAPCKVFWKTSSRKENSTPDYPYKEL
ncbi:centromere protein S isoform X4 [Canis lupus familiaris]|uniref:centromere protein S isoform X4 n=1 Tax=Canis lupus familiaris TaxID=9615 RepID=UPI0018F7E2E5|nr:centromere protein S isoform X4 [Canis lupus familiaris]